MKDIRLIVIMLCTMAACNKSDLIKKKSTTNLIIPTTPVDMQGLLDNDEVFAPCTMLNFISSDEFYFQDSYRLNADNKGAYTWTDFRFGADQDVPDWNNSYRQVYYCNTVLAGISRLGITPASQKELLPLMGDALFKRALANFNLLQVFTLPYDTATAVHDMGIPLRRTTNPQEPIRRDSLKRCYDSVISDLSQAVTMLPAAVDYAHRNRSNRPAALALMARVYLSMGAWQSARDSAQRCLAVYDSLMDFNTPGIAPFVATNPEVLYQSRMSDPNQLVDAFIVGGAFIDSGLLHSYSRDDLRDSLFFHTRPDGNVTISRSYAGMLLPFSGVSIPEVYLTLAESYARLQDTAHALQYLNRLLEKRWKTGTFRRITAASTSDVLSVILAERKKELAFKGLRWMDVRRLSKQRPAVILQRTFNGTNYHLEPGSLLYALPIPENIIHDNGITQNFR